MIPGEGTAALQSVSRAFTEALPKSAATRATPPDGVSARAAEDAEQAARAAADAVADAVRTTDDVHHIPAQGPDA
ncbi:hypothetical protein SAMN05421805_106112 [Saccharopolyspora antimicrobica]|uniref:Uncharacterized protein n=1 Tax=Saccharopolyspora antimicrobica TaxID=455193 RepID=A0A1I5B4I1_9PSEU|nr:hypothetical protein SAMN05421805_106112 [Saccharopolyspora antimicrobica]